MASGSQNMTTYLAKQVIGSNAAANPAGALLQSGANRADDSATGDTWLFLNTVNSTTNPWGIFHSQVDNKIKIIGDGTDDFWVDMDTGDTYILGNLSTGSTLTVRAQDDTHEGGEIVLSPATDSFSTVHIDVYDSMFRLHDGTNERFKVNVSSGNTTINGNLGIGADYAVLGGSYKLYVNGTGYISTNLTVDGLINNYKFSTQSSLNADDIRTTNGCWIVNAAITNAPTANHGLLLGVASVGTPNQMFFPDNQLYVYKRWYSSDAWTAWNKMSAGYADSAGSCTGNAATATKLQTARSLWGNNFDGTANVTGSLNMSTGDQINMTGSWDGFAFNYQAGKGTTQSTRFYNGNGGEIVRFTGAGSVGIGTTSPATKLHVVGTIRATGSPGFENYVAAGAWSYLRLNTSNYQWDIAANSSSSSNHLEFRANGGDTYKLRFTTDGRLEVRNQITANNSIQIIASNEASICYSDPSNTYTRWTVGRGPGSIGSSFGWWNGSKNVMTLGNDGKLTISAPFQDSVGAIKCTDTRTDAGWHYPFLGVSPSIAAGGNIYICIGQAANTGNSAGLRYQWNGANSDSNLLGFEFYGRGTPFYVRNTGFTYFNGTLNVWPKTGSYTEGARFHAYSGWTTIMLCCADDTADSGVTTNDWGFFNNNGTLYINKGASSGAGNPRVYANANGWYFTKAYGAVWNDFAEYRKVDIHEPGYTIAPSGARTSQRLESGVRITSDTYGYAIGYMENREDLMPVALAGRVLAYPYRNKDEYKIGDAVCSAPGGTVDIMTRDEIKEYPDRIIGIVNEIPDYDIWEPSRKGGGREPIHTNGRIWIDVK